MVGKQQSGCAAHISSGKESTTIKLKTTPREGKSERKHGAKNEAANSDHKDVNSPAAARAGALFGRSSGESCLLSDFKARRNGGGRLVGDGENGFVSGHEFTNTGVESKQARDDQGSASEKTEEPIGRTTSGRDDLSSEHSELEANSPLACPGPPIPSPCTIVSLKSPSLLRRSSVSGLGLKTKSLATSRDDKDGQSVSAREFQSASSSANSSDIKQHEKQLKTNSCSFGQNRSKLSTPRTRTPNLQQKKRDESANSYKCLNHKLGTKGINPQHSTRPMASGPVMDKLGALSDSLRLKSGNATRVQPTGPADAIDAHPISESHVLAEPMGQQVLSLMMLDAGLLPAGKDQAANEEKKSHVCLQSEPSLVRPICLLKFHTREEGRDDANNNNVDFETFKLNWLAQRDTTCRLSEPSTTIPNGSPLCGDANRDVIALDCKENGISRFSETFRLNNRHIGRFKAGKYNWTSVSLPSSPRAARGERFAKNAACVEKFKHLDLDCARQDVGDSDQDTAKELAAIRDCLTSLMAPTGGSVRKNSLSHHDDDSVGANSDASSCSSLDNHCPPMLSLLNPLDKMEFLKFIRADADALTGEFTYPTSESTLIVKPESELEIRPRNQLTIETPQTRSSTESCGGTQSTQKPFRTNNPVCGDNLSSEIDRLDEFGQVAKRKKEVSASGSNESEFEFARERTAELEFKKDPPINVPCAPQAPCESSKIKSLFDQGGDHPLESQSQQR